VSAQSRVEGASGVKEVERLAPASASRTYGAGEQNKQKNENFDYADLESRVEREAAGQGRRSERG